jgi:hypothetical protein
MAADVGLQKLWLFEGKRKKYFVFVRYKVQDNFCLTTYHSADGARLSETRQVSL